MTTAGKLGLLATLYLSQGLPFGFFNQAVPVFLRRQNVSLEDIGLSSLLAAPWAAKFLWAPLVDRHGSRCFGRRKAWIVPLQLCSALVMIALATLEWREAAPAILACVFLVNLCAASQDIATDALAVSLLGLSERGLGNGVQVAGYRVGMIIGGGALLIAFDHLGWRGAMLSMAALLALATVPIVLHREAPWQPPPERHGHVGALRSFLGRPGVGGWLVVLVLYKGGDALGTGMLRPFLVDRGLSLGEIGWISGTVGSAAGLVGALAGGALVGRLGRGRSLVVFGLLQAVSNVGYWWAALATTPREALYVVCGLEHLFGGMATVALFTSMMDRCRVELAGTDYTLQASVVVIATGAFSASSGFSASRLGYPGHFAAAAALSFVGLACAWLWQRRTLAA